MFEWLMKKYIRKCVVNSINHRLDRSIERIFKAMFKAARDIDHEANDSTLYAYFHDRFVDASESELKHVSSALRPSADIEQQLEEARAEIARLNAIYDNIENSAMMAKYSMRSGEPLLDRLTKSFEDAVTQRDDAIKQSGELFHVLKSYDGSRAIDQWDDDILPSRVWENMRKELLRKIEGVYNGL